jgi:hypothetical protein
MIEPTSNSSALPSGAGGAWVGQRKFAVRDRVGLLLDLTGVTEEAPGEGGVLPTTLIQLHVRYAKAFT